MIFAVCTFSCFNISCTFQLDFGFHFWRNIYSVLNDLFFRFYELNGLLKCPYKSEVDGFLQKSVLSRILRFPIFEKYAVGRSALFLIFEKNVDVLLVKYVLSL